ncbi:pentatricopeptide repeat-containing protein At5g66520-like isoform X1 [Typha angustifolia]|uniref:pentatricopeptide repeat-containing protein At5g66520-like isoform X1 n=1 Tax=Typha angustifolia TaxID=59011 RepID=UPI003C2D6B04
MLSFATLSSHQFTPVQKISTHSPEDADPKLSTHFSTPSQIKQLHAQLLKSGLPISTLPFPQIAAICALDYPSSFSYARQIFQLSTDTSETFLWNSHLQSLSISATPADALALFVRLRLFNVPFDEFTLSFVLNACSKLSRLYVGRAIHALVEKISFLRSNVYLLNTIVHMYACCGEMDLARMLFDRMLMRDVVSWNIMISQLAKRGEMESARELFDLMPEKSVRSWTALIAGYVQGKNPHEGIRLFEEMQEIGLRPNEVTVVAVLAACADLSELDLGRRVHEYSDRCGFWKNVRVCNTLIDMYIKCGCIETARKVFDGMVDRTVVSWSAMISGHAMHGQGKKALELFSRMTQAGLQPNGITFVGLLHACSHMGLLEEGRRFFASMTKDYGIMPKIEHYGCMVDLLSRAGLLDEAREFIKNMPIKPNSVVWGALLGGARVHKNVEIGEEAIRYLVKLDPLNDGYYVVQSNIYATAGRYDDVARMRCIMRERGVKKTPGWSTISLDGIMHKFVAGDDDHPQLPEIEERWNELLHEMRQRGYVPNTSVVLLDMDEVEKEKVVFRHSEKLAVVFGLMSTPPGMPIRVMKNLRVCDDCHAALKLISEITRRELIIRDRNRFHCFKDGTCSCNGYW